MNPIEISSEDDILTYDVEYFGVRPQRLGLPHKIINAHQVKRDIYVETEGGNYFLINALTPKTSILISEDRLNELKAKGTAGE